MPGHQIEAGYATASFMAIYMNITVYTSEDHRNNRSDVFKCVKLKDLEQ